MRWRAGNVRSRLRRRRNRSSSPDTISATLSTPTREAEISSASGRPSSRRTRVATASRLSASIVKSAATALTRQIADGALDVVIARPFTLVAADLPTTTALGNVRDQVLRGSGPTRAVRCGRLDIERDYVPVGSVVQALLRLTTDAPAGSYDVCTGTSTVLRDVVDEFATLVGVELAIEIDAELAGLPAGRSVVGDPGPLAALGLSITASPPALARELLGTAPS